MPSPESTAAPANPSKPRSRLKGREQAEKTVLAAIAEHYFLLCDWPTRSELLEDLGPTHGLLSIAGGLESRGMIRTTGQDDDTVYQLTLPAGRRSWDVSRDNVTRLGRYLACKQAFSGESMQSYYEKPWEFSSEYASLLAIEASEKFAA